MIVAEHFMRRVCFAWCVLFSLSVSAQQPVVLLLPQDRYPQATDQLMQGVRDVLSSPIQLVNVDDYPTLAKAWQAVQLAKPMAVIGPLEREQVEQLSVLARGIPVIALNQSIRSYANVWQLALRQEQTLYQLVSHWAARGVESVAVITHQGEKAKKLLATLTEVWPVPLVEVIAYNNRDQVLAASRVLLHSQSGRMRIDRLGQLLQQSLQSVPWVRQDIDAVVVLAPLEDALSLSYHIDYLRGQDLNLYWLDTGIDGLPAYVRSGPNWGRMKTYMPRYQLKAMQRVENNVDFFRALGRDAARVLQLRLGLGQWEAGVVIEGDLGDLTMGDEQRIQIQLPMVWLGEGLVDFIE
jgi:hypothetical protein